jgi:hypothetical protein
MLTFPRTLRAKDGDDIVGKPLVFETPFTHKYGKLLAVADVSWRYRRARFRHKAHT